MKTQDCISKTGMYSQFLIQNRQTNVYKECLCGQTNVYNECLCLISGITWTRTNLIYVCPKDRQT